MKKIPLSQGKFAIVDDEDFEFLSQWKWHLHKDGYAARTQWLPDTGGKKKNFMMHRVLNKTPIGMHTDHINNIRLDNRRKNLRTATRAQNYMNQGKKKNTTSIYKGVSLVRETGKWRSAIKR